MTSPPTGVIKQEGVVSYLNEIAFGSDLYTQGLMILILKTEGSIKVGEREFKQFVFYGTEWKVILNKMNWMWIIQESYLMLMSDCKQNFLCYSFLLMLVLFACCQRWTQQLLSQHLAIPQLSDGGLKIMEPGPDRPLIDVMCHAFGGTVPRNEPRHRAWPPNLFARLLRPA